MYALSNTQGFLRQRQGQGFGAGPDKKSNSMGSHGVQSETCRCYGPHGKHAVNLSRSVHCGGLGDAQHELF
jgi:hypothetical protein